MELQKGTCFLCCNAKVIKPSQSQKAYKIITLLLPKEILNPAEFGKIQSNVKFCPICYHKLVVIKRANKNIEAAKSAETAVSNEVSSNSCHLCSSLKNLFHIKNWPHFNAISEGNCSKNSKSLICSDCFFYLEIKHTLKTKLLSQYPRLGAQRLNNNENKRKWKLKFTPNIRLQSTQVSERKKGKYTRKRKFAEMIKSSSSAEDSLTDKYINFDSIKKFKPLKEQESIRYDNLINDDSKFLNQIPYVLISLSDLSNVYSCMLDEKCSVKRRSNEAFEENNETTEIFVTENIDDTKLDLTEKLKNKHGIKKHLVVNVVRMGTEQYHEKDDVESDVQNSLDKSEALQSLNETEEIISAESSSEDLTETQNNVVEEHETSFEIKNKRKSVSFAEEKNVEIEYFENEGIELPHISFEDDTNEMVTKQNKGILKRDENTEQNFDESQKQNEGFKGFDVNGETVDVSNNKELETKQNGQEQHFKVGATTNKIKARRNTHFVTESNIEGDENKSSDADNENLSEVLGKSENPSIDVTESEEKSNNIEEKHNANVEDISDDDTNIESSVNDDNGAKLKLSNNEEITEGESVDTKIVLEEDIHNISEHSADNEELKNNSNAKVKPRPASKKKKGSIIDFEYEKIDVSSEKEADGKKAEENLDKSEEIENNVDSVNDKDNNEDVETNKNDTEKDNQGEESSKNFDDTFNKSEEDHENGSVLNSKVISYEEEVCSSKSTSEDGKIMIVQSTVISEYSEEILNEDVTNNEKSKSESLQDNDVSQLVNKYLNSEDDNSSFINIEKKDTMLKGVTDDSFTNDECGDISKKMDCIPTSSFSDFDKHDEDLGLSEDDNENINSILSHIFSPDLPDDRILFETKSENNEHDSGDDVKRKNCDELNLSREKKKKKVTFCEDVT